MQEAGSCLAVMGNHDLNAVCLDPERPGTFLRPHTPKNLHQTASTRAEMERAPTEARMVVKWLRGLPLWLDLGRLWVAHAGWHPAAMSVLHPWINDTGGLTDEGLIRVARKNDPVRHAREMLLNGLEAELPNGMRWIDEDGHERSEARLAWWRADDPELTWREAALLPNEIRVELPDEPLPMGLIDQCHDASCPIFFGHYWMQWPLVPLTPIHACVDASVAANGRLAAYRFDGERELLPERFVCA